jgi:zinc protease
MRNALRREHVRVTFLILAASLLLWTSTTVSTLAATNGDVLRATLKNGLRVVIVHNPLAPVVSTMVNYLAGSNEAPPGFPGMAHAQEHMMFRGSPGLSAGQLSGITAALGGDSNADTQQTVTQYFFTVRANDLDVALRIEAIRMKGILDTEQLWTQERGAIEQEVAQDLSSPQYVFYQRLLESMFPGTPYAHDALGTRESFDKTTGGMLRDFHRRWYTPNNAILVIAGDVDLDQTLALVKRTFESIPSRPTPARPVFTLPPQKPATIQLDSDLPYGLAMVTYRLPGYDSPDFAAGSVLADVLDSKRGDLYALVPLGKALFAGFDGSALPKTAIGYATAGFPHGGNGADMVATLKQVIADYVAKGVPPDLVEAAKRHELADAEFRRNSIAGLAAEWSQAVAVEGRASPDEDIAAIQKVTVADVNRVAREYLVNDTAIVGILTPRASGKPMASTGFGLGKESFGPKLTKPVPLPAWARKLKGVPPLPSSTVHPTVFDLPNGLHLIVQPETISRTVTLLGRVKNNPDLQAPKEQEGVSEVLNGLFSYGTTMLDRLRFQEALDAIAANEAAGTSFSLQVLSDQLNRGVELLADNLLRPALPEPAFAVVKAETKSAVAGRLQSPGYLARRALRTDLYPKDDPSLREATPETVQSLTLEDVKAYYAKVFRPDMTTIVVIGNVTPEQARAAIEKYFGEWKATGPKPETDLPPVPMNFPAATVVPDPSRVQVDVTLAETMGLTRSNPDYYALQLGNHVLSGAFYATRLYRDLREQSGLVYSVETLLQVRKTRSVFGVFYACDPPNVSRARAMVERDLQQMRSAPVTPDELRQAKTLLLQQIPLSEASVDGIAGTLLALTEEELPLDEPVRAAHHYLELSAQDVQAAFIRWIRPQDFVQVTRGPNPQ